jgi:antitoxin component YwqK of YwqJK toxin-antitoxin module
MTTHSTILVLLFLTSCKTEFRKTVEKYSNGKVSVEYVYPDKTDTTKFTYVAYYENGDTMFKSQVKSMMFVGQKVNYFDNGKIEDIETLFKPVAFDDSLYDCHIIYFSPNGKPLKSLYYKNGVKALPAKYWLDRGITLTGTYYDSNHSTVLWKWFDKTNKLIKEKRDTGSHIGFIEPSN